MECIISTLMYYILLHLTIDCIGHKEHTVNIMQNNTIVNFLLRRVLWQLANNVMVLEHRQLVS